jgi:hypothetical protein
VNQAERLALAAAPAAAWQRDDMEAFLIAMDALYDAINPEEPAAAALHTAFAAQAEAARNGAGEEKRDAMAAMGMLALVEWVGCDVETFKRAVDELV